jgi:DNA polymerase III epsilon subunit-like protein
VIDRFKGADAYVAHNCSFERSFLGPHLGDTMWVCTYKCALRVWPDLAAHGNQALRYHFGHVNPLGVDRARLVPHRALSDAIVTAANFFELVKHASWPELVRCSEETVLLTYLRSVCIAANASMLRRMTICSGLPRAPTTWARMLGFPPATGLTDATALRV